MKPLLTSHLTADAKKWWRGETDLPKDATRKGFGRGLLQAGKTDRKLIALTANLGGSTSLGAFKEHHPARFIDVGVAEQSLAGIAAGMASEGHTTVMTSFATFSPGRNWDLIRTQIAMPKHPVLVVGSHAGLATGPDGATHQALEDIALMRSLPGMTILSPGDATETATLTKLFLKSKLPGYLRVSRAKTRQYLTAPTSLTKGRWLVTGGEKTIITTGAVLEQALTAARKLWHDHEETINVLHIPCLKPLDNTAIKKATETSTKLYTIEDHNTIGGLGSAVAEQLSQLHKHPPLTRIGVKDSFGRSGTTEELYDHYGLSAKKIAQKLRKG
ncbi:transketolase family protein [Candidatus Woesearchaeota archaeon]|nr:transketolase family protein [Candidatus Woesearchaeota archaeon]